MPPALCSFRLLFDDASRWLGLEAQAHLYFSRATFYGLVVARMPTGRHRQLLVAQNAFISLAVIVKAHLVFPRSLRYRWAPTGLDKCTCHII